MGGVLVAMLPDGAYGLDTTVSDAAGLAIRLGSAERMV